MTQLFERIADIRANSTLNDERRAESIVTLSPQISPTIAAQIVALDAAGWQRVTTESRRIYDRIWDEQSDGLSEDELTSIHSQRLPRLLDASNLNETERELVRYFMSSFLAPNETIDQEATEANREAARAEVEPVTVTVQQGASIVRAGDTVSDEVYEKLQQFGFVFGAGGIIAMLQRFMLGALVAWLLSSYLYFFQNDFSENIRSLAIIGGVAATVVLAARVLIPTWEPAPYGFPLAVAGILLTLLFNPQLGLVMVLILAPLVGLQAERSLALAITLALSGAAGVFAAQRATRSVVFVWVSVAVTLVTALAAAVFWYDRIGGTTWMQALSIPLLSALNGALASALSIGTYQLLGRVANVVTPLQLMELAHPSQPLLHRLMREAPGTYHHSIVVANLAEIAAEDIGADPLLARVGAYYHDIGKVIRPYFFTDNQYERSNVHDELDAKTSATLIIDHVRDGIKLAREHGLPQQIIDFIAQHHGTMIVSYFYQRALHEDGDVDIANFRYPGPKPQHRETGIMMLSDGVEAAVRANSQSGKLRAERSTEELEGRERSGPTIRDIVEQIVNDRVRAGELNECPLTLRDITIIKESFVKTLQGIYHPRVDYPPAATRQSTSEPSSEPASEPV
jgi:putative nucleotidyltransferase with HDIG domain